MVDVLEIIKPLSHRSVDAALAAALPTASKADGPRIVRALLDRERSPQTSSLIEHYHRLPEQARQWVIDQAWTMHTAIRTSSRAAKSQAAANAVEVIGQAGLTSMAYIAAGLVRSGDEPRQRAAAACLLPLALRCVADPPPTHSSDKAQAFESQPGSQTPALIDPQTDPGQNARPATLSTGDTLAVASALREAVVHYDQHRSLTVLQAVAVLMPVMPRAWHELSEVFDDPEHPAVEPMQRMLAQADSVAVRRALLAALRLGGLDEAAQAGLRRAAAQGNLHDALGQHQALGLPGMDRKLSELTDLEGLCPNPDEVPAWTDSQQQGLVRWLNRLPLGRAAQIARLAELAQALRGRARMMAVRRLIELSQDHAGEQSPSSAGEAGPGSEARSGSAVCGKSSGSGVDEPGEGSGNSRPIGWLNDQGEDPARSALAGYAAAPNAEPTSASAAFDALQAVRYPKLEEVLSAMLEAGQPRVRQMAADRLAPGVFDKLWRNWPRMSDNQRQALGEAWVKLDPDFASRLHEKLTLGERRSVLRALEVIRSLGQQALFEDQMLRLTRSADPSVAAAARQSQAVDDSSSAAPSPWALGDAPPSGEAASAGGFGPSTPLRRSGGPERRRPEPVSETSSSLGAVGSLTAGLVWAKAASGKSGDDGRITRVTPKAVSRSIQDGVGVDNPGPMILALTLVLLGLGLIQLVRNWRKGQAKRGGPTTLGLFHRVGHWLGLSWLDQWLLWRISRHAKLPTPLTLLISRPTLLRYGRGYARSQPRLLSVHAQRRIHQLVQRVFIAGAK